MVPPLGVSLRREEVHLGRVVHERGVSGHDHGPIGAIARIEESGSRVLDGAGVVVAGVVLLVERRAERSDLGAEGPRGEVRYARVGDHDEEGRVLRVDLREQVLGPLRLASGDSIARGGVVDVRRGKRRHREDGEQDDDPDQADQPTAAILEEEARQAVVFTGRVFGDHRVDDRRPRNNDVSPVRARRARPPRTPASCSATGARGGGLTAAAPLALSMSISFRPDPRRDRIGAFLRGDRVTRPPTGRGMLHGLTFVVKDVLDIRGEPTGNGNPDWRASHSPARSNAWAVDRWLDRGARMIGKTICDELAFSLEGANFHYGTPLNSRAPNRLPGGSSSGSASAVAAGVADGALGSDTGGSVRNPSSFCGIFGVRPTHGRLPVRGMSSLAPSYDTVGWFARDGPTLQRFGRALSIGKGEPPRQYALVTDAWELVEPRSRGALREAAEKLGISEEVRIYDGDPVAWYEAYRVLQGAEIWAQHREWIRRICPTFGPRTAERLAVARSITRAQVVRQARIRRALAGRVRALVRNGRALILPASPCIALSRRRTLAARAEFYRRALALNSVAGHAGLPEVVLPMARVEGCPIGIGVIAGAGHDESLLALAASHWIAELLPRFRGALPESV